jgi:putative endonuclease
VQYKPFKPDRTAHRMESGSGHPLLGSGTTKTVGDRGEALALAHLERAGLHLVCRHYRTPGRGGGEIDLIMRERDGTLVFVEVRARRNVRQGGAAATVGTIKQRRIVLAARHYLLRLPRLPACRFDVVAIDGDAVDWLRGAFELV